MQLRSVYYSYIGSSRRSAEHETNRFHVGTENITWSNDYTKQDHPERWLPKPSQTKCLLDYEPDRARKNNDNTKEVKTCSTTPRPNKKSGLKTICAH
ncbi:unnamed protein product [Cercopithifilaria johnstoni]|uniref:Uncharacterized protein n=1 Tax=Cercopithifilaria johnstoni TaxID=2874296 RepID=A0A8J2Q7I3_9BILA|nr:unnamed protein product [Cercopithifilaria johnstoni]